MPVVNRVIPILLISDGGLWKTQAFRNRKYVGDAVNAAKIFNDKLVDELIVIDIDATKNRSEPNWELIKDLSSECFMPLCYGGGISKLEDAQRIFDFGVEKIACQAALAEAPLEVEKIANKFGSQAVVAAIDYKFDWIGRFRLHQGVMHKNFKSHYNGFKFINQIASLGVGELLLTNTQREGEMKGLDIEVGRQVQQNWRGPVVLNGGVGSFQDILEAVDLAFDVGVGTYFVFQGEHKAVLISYLSEDEIGVLMDE